MISIFKRGLIWEIENKVALQSFFKHIDIVMFVEHAEALLEKVKDRIQFWQSKFNSSAK